jgi:MFS transporter, MHS family, shikimate and dehydroshikimate transport protein
MAAVQDVVSTSDPVEAKRVRRILLSSILGTAVEWYDFLIYAVATALVFNKLFFPSNDPALSNIIGFGTYGVGFFARPLGAAIFGHFGDRVGRKAMLAITIVIMGLGTFLIGLLPTYAQIGIAAPALLVALRFLQGIGLGGEWGGAVLMVVENADRHRRGMLGAMVQMGNPVGNLAAIGVFALVSRMPEADFLAWGWRIPFLVSVFLVGVGLFIRLRLQETPAFRSLEATQQVARMPLAEVFTMHRRSFFIAVGLKVSEIAWASIAGVYVISYATGKLGLPRQAVLNALLLASFVALFTIPLFGWLSDIVGRRTMFFASCLFSVLFAFPLFWLLDTRDLTWVTIAIVLGINCGQMVGFGVGAPWYSELFPVRARYSGASLGFQIGAALSGGLTPFIAAALVAWSGGAPWPIALYLIACALLTAVATFMAPETARHSID